MLFFNLPQVVFRREFGDQNQHHAIDSGGAKHIQSFYQSALQPYRAFLREIVEYIKSKVSGLYARGRDDNL